MGAITWQVGRCDKEGAWGQRFCQLLSWHLYLEGSHRSQLMHSEKLFLSSGPLSHPFWCTDSEAIELRLPSGLHSTTSIRDGPQPHLNFEGCTRSFKASAGLRIHELCPRIWVVQLSSGRLPSRWVRQCCIKATIACLIVLDRTGTR